MKYQIKCCKCGHKTPDFKTWFGDNQTCSNCGGKDAETVYDTDYFRLNNLYSYKPLSFWHYFDFLPITDKKNIVSFNEGAIPLEDWTFLSRYAFVKHNIRCRVVAYRNDLNGGTNTLKDVAASMTASVLKENGITKYCVASTGNTATSYAKYLAKAGIRLTVFAPNTINQDTVNEILSYGQGIVVSEGDYAQAKKEATEFSRNNNTLMSIGNNDPIRIESKRTMVFEFLRQLGKMPDVYMQAVGGGTGPIALDKGVRELNKVNLNIKSPRIMLVQQDLCDPMVQAWIKAKDKGFPSGYESDYPKIENPKTSVFILSAGIPAMYPVVARITRNSDGDFIRVREDELLEYSQIIYKEKDILIGPAAAVCVAGFYQALKDEKIKDGETVVVNIGESANRYIEYTKEIQKVKIAGVVEV
jgi:threonine synthase